MVVDVLQKGHLRGRRTLAQPDCRDLLLDIAETELLDHGMQGTTVREIAKRAGLSATMVYYHFGSKEGLVYEVFDRARHKLIHDLALFCHAQKDGSPSNEVLEDLAALLRWHLGEGKILGWLIWDPGVRRYDQLLAGLEALRSGVQDCLKGLPAWKRKSRRSDLKLKTLCRWAMLLDSIAIVDSPIKGVGRCKVPIARMDKRWHERLWTRIAFDDARS